MFLFLQLFPFLFAVTTSHVLLSGHGRVIILDAVANSEALVADTDDASYLALSDRTAAFKPWAGGVCRRQRCALTHCMVG